MKLEKMTRSRARAVACAMSLGAVLAPASLVGEELLVDFLQPVGKVDGASIEAFEWQGNRLYVWDRRAFKVWDATDWSDIQLMGEVAVGAPVQCGVEDRIQIIGSRAYLYDAEPVWLLNPDNTTVALLRYRMVIGFEYPTGPSVVGLVDFRSMHFASSGNVAVGSLARDGTTILEVLGSGDLVQRSKLRISGILTILDDRLYLLDEGAISVVDLTNLQ